MAEKTNIFTLTKQDTAVLKGIAIIAMLMHHLWGCPPAGVEPYTGLLGFLGSVGKVCVAIFLFCSGYGLSVGYQKSMNDCCMNNGDWKQKVLMTLKFLAKRFVKFYANYWFIFLIFVPISVFCFGRPLSAAYGESMNVFSGLVFDFFGIQGFLSYNITWWFNALILGLYVLFPFLYWGGEKLPALLLVLSILIVRLGGRGWMGMIPIFMLYQMPFVLGILWKKWESIGEHITTKSQKTSLVFGCVLLLMGAIFCREYEIIPHWSGMRMDGLITLGVTGLIVVGRRFKIMNKCFSFFGKHSMNTYLVHTFVYAYWFPSVFYGCELGGGMNLIGLLAICIIVSVLIEWMKNSVYWDYMLNKICQKLL